MTKEGTERQLAEMRKKLRSTSSPVRKAILQAAIAALLKILEGFFQNPAPTAAKPVIRSPRRASAKAK